MSVHFGLLPPSLILLPCTALVEAAAGIGEATAHFSMSSSVAAATLPASQTRQAESQELRTMQCQKPFMDNGNDMEVSEGRHAHIPGLVHGRQSLCAPRFALSRCACLPQTS